ncbi:hypothetical protein Daus18300_004815 [Diaporthe australafricana]|uniref:Ecp2 effector protein domain-containing protein n=1 Tax=Diaporthe australafricana TaxID=127596 RepID=A0ABR3X5G0_9PEZI
MTLSIANILIDVAILLLPVGVVVPLQMPKMQKASLLVPFATGGFREPSQAVDVYSTTVSKNRKRRAEINFGRAYELSSREEGAGGNSDEAKLWSRSKTTMSPEPMAGTRDVNEQDDDQETCGNTDPKPEGKNNILKDDCQKVVDYMKVRPGYWKVMGYNKHGPPADLVNRGTCEITVTREDALDTSFEFGNLDVIDFVEAAMRKSNDATRMPRVSGSVTCGGDFTPLVEWRVDFPLSAAYPSVRMSVIGWSLVSLSIFAFTLM